MHILKKIFLCVLAAMAGFPLFAQQEQEQDSLVVLISAKSAQMVDIEGASYRKVIGPARFLHNNTYLLCDTALWNVETRIIDAWGDVSILQEETVLTSEKLTYLIDNDLAQFRGTLVQLQDKDHNILRTRYLDYNTQDSVAIFSKGAAMRDKDGQIIESIDGTYDSKIKKFTFDRNVNKSRLASSITLSGNVAPIIFSQKPMLLVVTQHPGGYRVGAGYFGDGQHSLIPPLFAAIIRQTC